MVDNDVCMIKILGRITYYVMTFWYTILNAFFKFVLRNIENNGAGYSLEQEFGVYLKIL